MTLGSHNQRPRVYFPSISQNGILSSSRLLRLVNAITFLHSRCLRLGFYIAQFDLDLSVQRELWATQPHNEPVLDQAYRTSSVVYLIFSVNKSGEFFGYAK